MPFVKGYTPWIKGRKMSEEHKRKIGSANKGRAPAIKGTRFIRIADPSKVSYSGIHVWLIRNFGKATRCENVTCAGRSKTYDWALIKGGDYKRLRNCFMMMCRSCHVKYDKQK